jgi:alkyl hydroperoxide reductase subunit F
MKKIEVYSKEWCPYCAKAKSLLKSKNLEYQVIDITNDDIKEEEMIQRSERCTVPQIFIDGKSIGGYDDLANFNATGQLDELLEIKKEKGFHTIYDVAVLGAGPAGMTAAIYCARKNLKTVMIAYDSGGQVGTTYEIGNYPGFEMITGPDLVDMFSKHVNEYNIETHLGEKISAIEINSVCKNIITESGLKICSRTVIVATGAFKRTLNIPGEKELAGKGVVYCATCDGPLFKGMDIAVIGGGNSALEAAIEMNSIAKSVSLISKTDWSGDAILQDKINSAKNITAFMNYQPLEIHGNDHVTGLTIKNKKTNVEETLKLDGVFIEVGLYPNSDFIIDLVETNDRGQIKVDRNGDTGVKGIFAAGDVTDGKDNQIIVAAGEGATAALNAFNYLVTQV